MGRPLRIEIENGIYHVTSRGWERRLLVRDERDRQKWLELVDRVVPAASTAVSSNRVFTAGSHRP